MAGPLCPDVEWVAGPPDVGFAEVACAEDDA